MRILNLLKFNPKKKKSQVLLFGSLLVFFGCVFLLSDYFVKMKNEVFNDMKIAMMGFTTSSSSGPVVQEENTPVINEEPEYYEEEIDYSVYLGVLEIPRIGLKRGFYSVDSNYNNIAYNVTLVSGSDMPDVPNGNLILMAHSGDSYISYFAYLYMLEIGDDCYITYNGLVYHYRIVNIYNVEKNGIVNIDRNYDQTTLTMITCTKNSDSLQTVYIAEFVG